MRTAFPAPAIPLGNVDMAFLPVRPASKADRPGLRCSWRKQTGRLAANRRTTTFDNPNMTGWRSLDETTVIASRPLVFCIGLGLNVSDRFTGEDFFEYRIAPLGGRFDIRRVGVARNIPGDNIKQRQC